jgi:hypothetical protein
VKNMPHFTKEGREEWICQKCGYIFGDKIVSTWRPDITGHKSAGNVCPFCLWEHEEKKSKLDLE